MLKLRCCDYDTDGARELCRLLGITQRVVDKFEDNNIDDILSYADENGVIRIAVGEYMSADTMDIVVYKHEEDSFEHHMLITCINACEEGPFWEMPLDYLMFLLKGELRNHGIYVCEHADEKDGGISG